MYAVRGVTGPPPLDNALAVWGECPRRPPDCRTVRSVCVHRTGLTPSSQAIKSKYTVINRAPIMMAWAFVVAERMGFQREEALSIGRPPPCLELGEPGEAVPSGACTGRRRSLSFFMPMCSLCVHGDERNNERRLARALPRRKAEGQGSEPHRLAAVRRAHGQTVSPPLAFPPALHSPSA